MINRIHNFYDISCFFTTKYTDNTLIMKMGERYFEH